MQPTDCPETSVRNLNNQKSVTFSPILTTRLKSLHPRYVQYTVAMNADSEAVRRCPSNDRRNTKNKVLLGQGHHEFPRAVLANHASSKC